MFPVIPPPRPPAPGNPYLLALRIGLFWMLHVNGIKQYVAFGVGFLSLSVKFEVQPCGGQGQYSAPFYGRLRMDVPRDLTIRLPMDIWSLGY